MAVDESPGSEDCNGCLCLVQEAQCLFEHALCKRDAPSGECVAERHRYKYLALEDPVEYERDYRANKAENL